MGEMSLSLLCFSTMNPMDPAGPLDNSVFVVAPHNSYPATQEGMCQVALYPSNQPQVHQLPVNPPGLKPSVSEQPVRRALKEGKALGVRELSLCRPGVTGWSQTGRGGGGGTLEIQQLQIQRAGLELTQPCQIRTTRNLSCATSPGSR